MKKIYIQSIYWENREVKAVPGQKWRLIISFFPTFCIADLLFTELHKFNKHQLRNKSSLRPKSTQFYWYIHSFRFKMSLQNLKYKLRQVLRCQFPKTSIWIWVNVTVRDIILILCLLSKKKNRKKKIDGSSHRKGTGVKNRPCLRKNIYRLLQNTRQPRLNTRSFPSAYPRYFYRSDIHCVFGVECMAVKLDLYCLV